MSGVVDRARAAAEARADGLRGQVQRHLAEALPGVSVEAQGDEILVTGQQLVRRWIASGALRNLRELLR